jgi:DNA-binding GntR family transcriptional regulator
MWNEHASILEAMAEGDAEIAAELMPGTWLTRRIEFAR